MVACWQPERRGGIELYDFEPCSGRLKHARILDTVPAMGLCFSPDDSKLYASYNKRWRIWYQGEIYQYDLRAGTLSAIAASRTLVMRNPIYTWMGVMWPEFTTGPLGAMKIGLDARLYVSKNIPYWGQQPCSLYVYSPGSSNNAIPGTNPNCYQGQYMHVIHNPDLPGTLCNAELDFFKLNDLRLSVPGLLLHQDISAALPTGPDTLPGQTFSISACFRSDQLLEADTAGSCYYWDDGSSDATRRVTELGTYWVRYFKHCHVQTDTFIVALSIFSSCRYCNLPVRGKALYA